MICIPHAIGYYSGNVTKNERRGARGTFGGVERCVQTLVGKPEGKRPLGNPRRRGDGKGKM